MNSPIKQAQIAILKRERREVIDMLRSTSLRDTDKIEQAINRANRRELAKLDKHIQKQAGIS